MSIVEAHEARGALEAGSLAPRVVAAANRVLADVALMANPYFTSLADGSLSLQSFRASQRQFFFAVRYFPRPMAALISRMPEPEKRLDLVHNLVEEHGDFRPEAFHQNTFRSFLKSIGTVAPDVDGTEMGPAVHAFNCTIMGACSQEPVEVGIGCMGFIEHAFAGICAHIGRSVIARGWVPASEMVHYSVHAELDVRHAEEFFAVVEGDWDHAGRRLHIEQGLRLGAYAFEALYGGMLMSSRRV